MTGELVSGEDRKDRTPEQEALGRSLTEGVKLLWEDWEQTVFRSKGEYKKLTAAIYGFTCRTDHGLAYPIDWLAKVLDRAPSTISLMAGDGGVRSLTADLLLPQTNVPSNVLRPLIPLLPEPEFVRSALVDCLEQLPGGEKLTQKRVKEAADPYRKKLEKTHKPRGAAAHKTVRRLAEPSEPASGIEVSTTQDDESAVVWTDTLLQAQRDVLKLAQAHPEVRKETIRLIRRVVAELADLAASDAAYLIFPDQVSPEAGYF